MIELIAICQVHNVSTESLETLRNSIFETYILFMYEIKKG